MGLGDAFRSEKDRNKDERRERRHAFRQAEAAVDAVKEKIAKLQRDREKAWNDARDHVKNGQKGSAQRAVETCRGLDTLIAQLDKKRLAFEHAVASLDMAGETAELIRPLGRINAQVQVDPDAVADVMGEVEDKLGEQGYSDQLWDKMHGKQSESARDALDELVPSMDELTAQLQSELDSESAPGTEYADEDPGSIARPKKSMGEQAPRMRTEDLLDGEDGK